VGREIAVRHSGLLGSLTFSDKFGQSRCVILRDSCKLRDLHFPL